MDCGNRPECSEIADRAVKKTFAILGSPSDNLMAITSFICAQALSSHASSRTPLQSGHQSSLATVFTSSALTLVGAVEVGVFS